MSVVSRWCCRVDAEDVLAVVTGFEDVEGYARTGGMNQSA